MPLSGRALCYAARIHEMAELRFINLLGRLLEKSLVTMELHGGEARYRLLETQRQFGYERLAARGELERTEERCTEWFIAFAETVNQQLHAAQTGAALACIELECDNLSITLKRAFRAGRLSTRCAWVRRSGTSGTCMARRARAKPSSRC
jgi:predicted ATPase